MSPHNIMEIIIKREIKYNKDKLQLKCDCERCLSDILAIALNHFPPKYVVNEHLEPYIRVSYEMMHQGKAEILAQITHAAQHVGKNPRCDRMKKVEEAKKEVNE